MQLDTWMLMFISGSLIPFATAALTKLQAHRGLKAICSVILSAAVAVVGLWQGIAGVVNWKVALVTFIGTALTQSGIYQGVYKPTGATQPIAAPLANVGIG